MAWLYTRRYACTIRSNWASHVAIISGLTFSLLTMLLIPLDVFFASYAKLPNGTWADWAKNGSLLQDVEDTLEDTYFGTHELASQRLSNGLLMFIFC